MRPVAAPNGAAGFSHTHTGVPVLGFGHNASVDAVLLRWYLDG